MANLKVENSLDAFGKPIVRLAKKKGDIKLWEAFEAMVKADNFGHYMMHIFVTEEAPEDLYDEGDIWDLYPVDSVLGDLAEEKYNQGYEECQNVTMPDAEWGGNGKGKHMCGCCGGIAPADPYCPTERWHSRRCPHCGAVMTNGTDPGPLKEDDDGRRSERCD